MTTLMPYLTYNDYGVEWLGDGTAHNETLTIDALIDRNRHRNVPMHASHTRTISDVITDRLDVHDVDPSPVEAVVCEEIETAMEEVYNDN